MADNITAPAAGAVLATDEIANVHYPETKIVFGPKGTATALTTTDRLPVQTQTGLATEAKQDDMIAAIENLSPGGGGGGDASAANQDQQTALLTTIDTKLGGSLAVTGAFYPATQPVSGTVSISGSVAVTGPLTDAQLRATALPVSGTFWQATQPVSIAATVAVSGPLTDTQLRATAVPVSGPLTDTQLRATAVPTSLATLPALVTGSAIIGRVGIDQTTDGTTNKVNIDASLKSGTPTRSSVNSGTSSVTILASNANRKGATILNSDANALLLDLSGGTAASTRYQVRLAQYQSYEVGSGYTGAITGIWEADGAGIADVVEFT